MQRFDIYQAELDPVRGQEMAKTRPVIIVSPDEANKVLSTIIAVPLTSAIKSQFKFRIPVVFKGREGQAAIDQVRILAKQRCIKKLGKIEQQIGIRILHALQALFAE